LVESGYPRLLLNRLAGAFTPRTGPLRRTGPRRSAEKLGRAGGICLGVGSGNPFSRGDLEESVRCAGTRLKHDWTCVCRGWYSCHHWHWHKTRSGGADLLVSQPSL